MQSVTVSIVSPSICHEVMGSVITLKINMLNSPIIGDWIKKQVSCYQQETHFRYKDTKELKVKGEHEKADLKLSIQKMQIMASGPITSWQIHGETMETVRDFLLGGSKITAATKLKDTSSLDEKL